MPDRATRRSFLQALGAGAVGLAAGPLARAADPPARRPNILLIMSDDMGYSDLGCFGGELRTPTLDSLAAGGVRFAQFYNTARCCPSRAALLTGLYPHQAGVGHMTGNQQRLEGYQGQLNERCVTIAEALRPAGYGTYMAGKWHVCHNLRPDGDRSVWPLQRGFDRYYGILGGAADYFDPGTLCRDNTHLSPFADPEYRPDRYYFTEALGDQTARFIREHTARRPDDPWFCYLAFTAAHWPLHALEEDIASYRGRFDGGYEPIRRRRFERLRELGLIRRDWAISPQEGDWSKVANPAWEARCMEVYAAQVTALDRAIGTVVEQVRRLGSLDDTLILFLQDNGACQEAIGRTGTDQRAAAPSLPTLPLDAIRLEGRPKQNRRGFPVVPGTGVMPGPDDTYASYGIAWANVSNTPFREYKHFVHEGGIATPLIAHWPRGIARRGAIEQQPGHLTDLMATCLDVAGAKLPAERNGQPTLPVEGRSLVPAFAGQPVQREAIFWEHEGNRALRVGSWKLVAKKPAGAWELYNLEADRTELHDLAAAEPQRARAMAAQWDAIALRTKAVPWPWKPAYGQPVTTQTVFDLKAGEALDAESAPQLPGRGVRVTATIQPTGADGVIVAHGGTQHGYALYLKAGRLELATRHGGTQTTVTAPDALPAGAVEVGATVAANGALTLLVGGRQVAAGQAPGPWAEQPVDGLQVGRDEAGTVGRYQGRSEFAGQIVKLRVEVL